MTNEQSVMEAEQRAEELKNQYVSYLHPIATKKINYGTQPSLDELLKCQQLGTKFFNYVEGFVGTSGLLGAHVNGKWVTGFAETCHSILDTIIDHQKFLNSYSGAGSSSLKRLDINAYANMQRMTKEYLPKKTWQELKNKFVAAGLPITGFNFKEVGDLKETPKWQLITVVVIGLIFAFTILIVAILIPSPTAFQLLIFRGFFALSLAAVGAMIPGFLNVESRFKRLTIKATGAIAVFVIIWLINPPALVIQ